MVEIHSWHQRGAKCVRVVTPLLYFVSCYSSVNQVGQL